MSETPCYSLVDEPWIKVMIRDGTPATVSLRQIFDAGTDITAIRGDSPTQDYAVLRVILAIFWRSHQEDSRVGPGETFRLYEWLEQQLSNTEQPDHMALAYLDKHRDRFDLIHPEYPFMQVASLTSGKDNAPSISRIIPEAENNYFTMRTGEPRQSVSLGEAARWLIHCHAYDYSGIKTGMQGDDRVKGGRGYPIGTGWAGMTGGTVILGENLRETLALNTTVSALSAPDDLPVWEREPDFAGTRDKKSPPDPPMPTGPADFATWQTRRVRLFTENGRVTRVFVGNGDKIADAGANAFGDPMTPYRYSTNKSTGTQTVYYPAPYSAERTLWRSLEPLLVLSGDIEMDGKKRPPLRPENLTALGETKENLRLRKILNVQLVSMSYGPQASSVETIVNRQIEFPAELLPQRSRQQRRLVLSASSATNEACVAFGSYVGQLAHAAGGEYAFNSTATDEMLGTLEPAFAYWLKNLDIADIASEHQRWHTIVAEAVVEQAKVKLRGAGPRALIGREEANDDNTRIISAGTAFQWLNTKLRDVLPHWRSSQKPAADKEVR